MKNTTIDLASIIDIIKYREDESFDLPEMFGLNDQRIKTHKQMEAVNDALKEEQDKHEDGMSKTQAWKAGFIKAIEIADSEAELAFLVLFVIEAVTRHSVKSEMMQRSPLAGLLGMMGEGG